MARYSTVVALVFLLFSAGTLLAREEGSFAVLGRSEILVERGAVVRGGDVGVLLFNKGQNHYSRWIRVPNENATMMNCISNKH